MNIECKSFTYNGITLSSEYMVCTFDSPDINRETGLTRKTNRGELTTFRARPNYYSSAYSDVLKFDVSLVKKDSSDLSQSDLDYLIEWLASPLKHEVFTIEDYNGVDYHKGIEYFAICTDVKPFCIGSIIRGCTFSFECDSPYGYTGEIHTAFIGGTSINIKNISNEINIDYYPTVHIKATEKTDATIVNSAYPDEVMTLKMVQGQELDINCETGTIYDKFGLFDFSSDTNRTWIHLKHGTNRLTIQGMVEGYVLCRYVRKVGI